MVCRIKKYLSLTKPGIIMGNLIPAGGGFALACRGHIDIFLFLATMVGVALVIAAACVGNNYFDRKIDGKMARTRCRPLVQGLVSGRNALVFALILAVCGFLVLGLWTSLLTVGAALAGFVGYVVLYGIYKYRTSYGTLIGSFAGAMPPVVGYTAVSHQVDGGVIILFSMMVLWQMPHFFAIAIRRLEDYIAAAIPVLPAVKGVAVTKVHMAFYVVAFVLTSTLLTVFGYTGYGYLAVALALGGVWIWLSLLGFKAQNDNKWARKMFTLSLLNITALCLMLAIT